MRPIRRDVSPQATDFTDYTEAKPFLVSRLGSGWFDGIHVASYCSYCERPIVTSLAVEHIQPKGYEVGNVKPYEHLEGRWENFLLACVNCNSTKKDKNVVLNQVMLPDRDNTFVAYDYTKDGKVKVSMSLHPQSAVAAQAARTLSLTGLDKKPSEFLDENGRELAFERVTQRMNTWLLAESTKADIDSDPTNINLRRGAIRTAVCQGFFSIWMTVFSADADMRNRLIDAFAGTRGSSCFDPVTTLPISPAPNPDNLADGGKV